VPVLPTAASLDPERPTVLVLDRALLQSAGSDSRRIEELARAAVLVGIGDASEHEPPADFPVELLTGYLPSDAAVGATMAMLRGALRHAATQVGERRAVAAEEQRHRELTELSSVGVALSTERDLTTLLQIILSQARRLTTSDAGSVYLVERRAPSVDQGPAALRFKLAQNDTLPSLPFSEFTVPVDHTSLAGYAAATGEPLVIGDVYRLRAIPYRATEQYARAVRLSIGTGSRIHEAEARLALAVNDFAGGQPSSARDRAGVALDIARKSGLRIVECQILHLLAVVDDAAGRGAQAAERCARARAIEAETGYRPPPQLPMLIDGADSTGPAGTERHAGISVP